MPVENLGQIIGIVVAAFGVLLVMNIFFVKRLVSKIEMVPALENSLKELKSDVGDMKKDIHDLIHVRERVAVLEYAMKQRRDN